MTATACRVSLDADQPTFVRVRFESNAGQTFAVQGRQVAQAVAAVRRWTGASQVVLVGHSMGGLAARAYLQSRDYAGDVAALVTVATPHLGSLLPYIRPDEVPLHCRVLYNLLRGVDLTAPAVEYLAPDSPELTSLNTGTGTFGALPPDVRYVSVIATFSTAATEPECLQYREYFSSWQERASEYFTPDRQRAASSLVSSGLMGAFSDGVVPVASQYLKVVPVGFRLPVEAVEVSGFHTDVPENEDVAVAIERAISGASSAGGSTTRAELARDVDIRVGGRSVRYAFVRGFDDVISQPTGDAPVYVAVHRGPGENCREGTLVTVARPDGVGLHVVGTQRYDGGTGGDGDTVAVVLAGRWRFLELAAQQCDGNAGLLDVRLFSLDRIGALVAVAVADASADPAVRALQPASTSFLKGGWPVFGVDGTVRFSFAVHRNNDGQCCPSGGTLEGEFRVELLASRNTTGSARPDFRLEVEQASVRRADAAGEPQAQGVVIGTEFQVTRGLYRETDDLDAAVVRELGAEYRLADWADVRRAAADPAAWADAVGMADQETFLLGSGGNRLWNGRRHYFMQRFNSRRPYAGFAVHDQIGGQFLVLGSWYGLQMRLLAHRR